MKNLFITLFLFAALISSAQMSLKKLDGTPINDGDVFTFDVATEPGSYLGIKIFNSSANDINVKVKVESMTNTTGTNVQLCLGNVCISTIVAGNSYPNIPALIEANGENGNFDHFLNLNAGINASAAVEYRLKFFQVDDLGIEIGNSVAFSYRFISALGVTNFQQLEQFGVIIKSNVVGNDLELNTLKDMQCQIYDVSGKLVNQQTITSGNNTIDVSNMRSGVYVIAFQNKQGQRASTRLIKK